MKRIQYLGFMIQMILIGGLLLSLSACNTADSTLVEDEPIETDLHEARIQEVADRAVKAESRLEEIRLELIDVQQALEQREADVDVVTQRLIRTQRLVAVLLLILIGMSYSLWRVRFAKRGLSCPDWRSILVRWGLLKPTGPAHDEVAEKKPEPKKKPAPKKPATKTTETKAPETKKSSAKKPAAKKPGASTKK